MTDKTVGEWIAEQLRDAQERGGLRDWTWDFTDEVDSSGEPWPEAPPSWPVGSFTEVFESLGLRYEVDNSGRVYILRLDTDPEQ